MWQAKLFGCDSFLEALSVVGCGLCWLGLVFGLWWEQMQNDLLAVDDDRPGAGRQPQVWHQSTKITSLGDEIQSMKYKIKVICRRPRPGGKCPPAGESKGDALARTN
jgi:hypothetical protein